MVVAIHWRAVALHLALFPLILALGLSACGPAAVTSSAPAASGPQAGLEIVLHSGNARLIAETILQLMDLPGHADTNIETLIARLRATPLGRASIERAAGVLLTALDSADSAPEQDADWSPGLSAAPSESNPTEGIRPEERLPFRSRGEVLMALSALAPDGRQRDYFMAEFRKLLMRQPSQLETRPNGPAIGIAAFLYERQPGRRVDLLATANGQLQENLLLAALRLRARLPAPSLRAMVSRLLHEARQDPLAVRTRFLRRLGFALRLLENVDARPIEGTPTVTTALARAQAALEFGEADRARAALIEAANAPATETSTEEWFAAVSLLIDEYPAQSPELRTAADRLIGPGAAEPYFFERARLGSTIHVAAAERLLQTATGYEDSETYRAEDALIYLDNAGQARRGIVALCDSAWGRRSADVARSPPPWWVALVADLPADQAASLVRDRVSREPERARSNCVGAIAAAQAGEGKMGAREARSAGIDLQARPLPAPSPFMARWASKACRTIAMAFVRPGNLGGIEAERLLDYTLACPTAHSVSAGDSFATGNRLAALLHMPLRQQFLTLRATEILSGERVGAFFLDGRTFVAVLDDGAATRQLDHSRLIGPLLLGSGRWDGSGEMNTTAARLILVAGKDADIATWVVARLNNYDPTTPEATTATFSLLRRAWHDVGRGDERPAEARERFGVTSSDAATLRETQRREAYASISDEAAYAVQQFCGRSGQGEPVATSLASGGASCIGAAADEAAAFARELREAGFSSTADAIDAAVSRERTTSIISWTLLALAAHLLVWALLFLLYPISPTIQASVFWNPWIRKYLGLGYVQLLLLVVPPFTRRLLAPFRGGFTRDGQLDGFRPEIYYDDIRGVRARPEGPEEGRLAALIPAVDGKIWLEAKSGSGKSWFLRNLALRIRRPLIFLNATSCAGGVTAAIKARTHGWLAESDFLEQLVYAGRIVIVVDGLNEVAAAIRSDIVAYADRFPRGRVLIATQPVQTAPPVGARRVAVRPLDRAQIEGFLLGRADEVLAPDEDRAPFARRVAGFLDSLEHGTPKEREELLAFVSNPMDLRLTAALLARGIAPDLLNLQKQQIELVERDYLAANGNPFPVAAFAEALYALRCADKSLILGESDWPAEREALRAERLVLRTDGPDGKTRWRFRHDKITDYFLYVAFKSDPDRQEKHLSDNRFIGVYVLIARYLDDDVAMDLLQRISWEGGEKDDFTVTRAFQEALTQKLALQRGTAARPAAPPRTG